MFYIVWFHFSICSFGRINSLDMATAVQYLRESDANLQVLGAAYIQHECYNDSDAKNEVAEIRLVVRIPLGVQFLIEKLAHENCFPSSRHSLMDVSPFLFT